MEWAWSGWLTPFGPPPAAWLLGPSLLLALGLLWLYRVLFKPLHLVRRLHDVGYVPEPGADLRQTANQVRRRRKRGDLPPVYPNGWYRLLGSRQLPAAAVKNVTVFGEQLAVYRGDDGRAYAVDAYCPHLGANLAVGGRVIGDCIECPFHGWQFRGHDGKCTVIPYAERVPEFARVRSWPLCEVNGALYVWFHCDGLEPGWSVPVQNEIQSGEWVFRGDTEHLINCHIQEIPENAADVAHLTHLHSPAILSGTDLRNTRCRRWGFMRHDWKVQWSEEPVPERHCSRMLVNHTLHILGWRCPLLDLHVVARQVGPGLVYMLFNHAFLGRGVILHCVTPVEPLLQCVTHCIYYQSNMPALIPKALIMGECIQFERDVMIWNNKTYMPRPLLVKEDSAIVRHRRWYSQFYTDNSPRFPAPNHSLDW